MSDDGTTRLDLPDELAACHELIRKLGRQNQELREKLTICENNERQVFQHIYGPGATPTSLLNFGLLMAGKEPIIRSSNPDDPTVGEVYARERAERRRQRAEQRRQRRQRRNDQGA
jgi:hypothetical protein